ncbi:hypothetical protein FKM82_021884 [Ascaphus truei]
MVSVCFLFLCTLFLLSSIQHSTIYCKPSTPQLYFLLSPSYTPYSLPYFIQSFSLSLFLFSSFSVPFIFPLSPSKIIAHFPSFTPLLLHPSASC